jgi:outer membrane protein assembly factor BamB
MIKTIRFGLSVLSLSAVACLISGCEKDNTPVPNALTQYPFSVNPRVIWKTHATEGSGVGTTLGLSESGTQLIAVGHQGSIALLDKKTGKESWEAHIPYEISARAVSDHERIFVPTKQGVLVALSLLDGKVQWRTPLSSLSLSGVAVESGIVIVHEHNGNVSGLDATSGLKLWTYTGSVPSLGLQGSSEPVANSSMAYIGTNQGQLFAFDLQSGLVKWNRPIAIPDGATLILRMVDINSTPILDNGTLYAASYHGNLVSVNASSGGVIWQRPFSVYQNLYQDVSTRSLLLTDEKSDEYNVDSTQGATLWKQSALAYRNVSAPTVLNGHVLVGDYQGYVHSLSLATGSLEGRVQADHSAIVGQGVSDADASYFVTQSGEVFAIQL